MRKPDDANRNNHRHGILQQATHGSVFQDRQITIVPETHRNQAETGAVVSLLATDDGFYSIGPTKRYSNIFKSS